MEAQRIEIAPAEARKLWRSYREHVHYSTPIDREVMAAYQKLAQGRLVIRAIDSIKAAGVDEQGRPKLAIVRADAKRCFWEAAWRGQSGMFIANNPNNHRFEGQRIVIKDWPAIPANNGYRRSEAIVPLIPLQHRPKRGLANYHILWEADWRDVPVDPYLLRRIGKSDLWIVCAMWDLTEIERAVLAGRPAA